MAFVLSILYLVVCYLTPVEVFGAAAQYRIELILAGLIFLVSIPALQRSFIHRTVQFPALIGLSIAVFLSILIGVRWMGGALTGIQAFLPCIYAYFIVCLHCNSIKKLKILVVMLFFVAAFVIAHGADDLFYGSHQGLPASWDQVADTSVMVNMKAWDAAHPYLLLQRGPSGDFIYRIRGLGEIHDPNDFAQFLVCLLPLLFLFWRPKKRLGNFVIVILPAAIVLTGIFLTHSRGALLALMAVFVLAIRRRIGLVPSVILASTVFAGAMALQFTGGRSISADAGEDRTALWGAGLQMLKTHPIFGVGYNDFADASGLGHTAHNSVIVCAAELGFFGLYFWSLFLLPTIRSTLVMASPSGGPPIHAPPEEQAPLIGSLRKLESLESEEVARIGRLLMLSLAGFLVAGWFLSRAFVITLFLLGGITEVVYQMAYERRMISVRLPWARAFAYAFGLAILLVCVAYGIVRVLNFSR